MMSPPRTYVSPATTTCVLPPFEAGLVGAAVVRDRLDERRRPSTGEVVLVGDVGRHGLAADAEVGVVDAARAEDLGDDVLDGVRRDGEPDADVAGRGVRPVSICVLTPMTWPRLVEERAARVAVVDRRVGLDDVVDREAVRGRDEALERAHDPGRSRCGRARTGCRSRRPGSPTWTASELPSGRGVSALADVLDAEDGEVGRRIGADDLGLDGVAVREADGDLVRTLDDVVVRDDVAGLVDDEAGAERRVLPANGSTDSREVELFVALTRTTPEAARS